VVGGRVDGKPIASPFNEGIFSILTAHALYSGVLGTGSGAALVRRLVSTFWYWMDMLVTPRDDLSVTLAVALTSPRLDLARTVSPSETPSSRLSHGADLDPAPGREPLADP